MENKRVIYDTAVKEVIIQAVEKLSNVVSVTLGPSGRNVLIGDNEQSAFSTKDGVTVAKAIKLEDPAENMIVQILKEAASQTNDAAGDGTTTATVLSSEIIKEGIKAIKKDVNSVDLCRGIQKGSEYILKKIKDYTKDISNEKQIEQVAVVSANNDLEIGKIIATAIKKVGKEGVVTVEESPTPDMSLELVEGMQFKRGYLSPYFINNNSTMQVLMENPKILIYDDKISGVTDDFINFLEKVSIAKKPLLIIAHDVDGEALATLIVNKLRSGFNFCAVKAPDFAKRRQEILEDIAVLTGGTVVTKEKGLTFENLEMEHLGSCKNITIDNFKTTLIDGKGSKDSIKERIEMIKNLIEKADSKYDKEKLQERLAKLLGGVAVLRVGANSEVEMKDKKFRVEDALNATRAAIEEGIIPGGGVVLMKISKEIQSKNIKKFAKELKLNKNELLGFEILISALQKPFEIIVKNSGKNPETIWEKISRKKSKTFGFNVRDEKIVDMIKDGIIDPKKVTRVALEKAVSVASILLTTESIIYPILEEKKEKNYE